MLFHRGGGMSGHPPEKGGSSTDRDGAKRGAGRDHG